VARREWRHGSDLDDFEPDPKHDARLHADFTACSLEELPRAVRRVRRVLCDDPDAGALLKGGDEDMQRCLAVRDLLKILMLVAPPDFPPRTGARRTPGSGASIERPKPSCAPRA
jgi:hypothetical protein